MAEAPQLDGRRAAAIRADVADLVPYYTDDWDPAAGGVGTGLLDVFAELGAEVTERLDAAPAKHRVSFYDALGFAARPPQAARVPVQYTLAPEAPRNVAVRPGTAAVAEASEEVEFHVGAGDAFEATPARLTDVIAVHPSEDAIYDHGSVVDGSEGARLWYGDNVQTHEWYVGDADLLSAGDGDEIVLAIQADVDAHVLRYEVDWFYYGTDAENGSEGWKQLQPGLAASTEGQGTVELRFEPAGELVEYAVDGVESKWLRASVPDRPPADEHVFDVESVGVRTGTGKGKTAYPSPLLANDVPQENSESADKPITPFGDQPRPNDAFYIADQTALTKPGALVTLTFTATGEDATAATSGGQVEFSPDMSEHELETYLNQFELSEEMKTWLKEMISTSSDPSLSWEYWDGEGWSRLDIDVDGTAEFTKSGENIVRFYVPEDLAPTTVAGHDGHWIRVRLVGGDYGNVIQVPQDPEGTKWAKQLTGSPPEFESITRTYTLSNDKPPTHVRTHNALASSDHAADETFRPFRTLAESEQTLYLGFDRPLSGGPLQLFAGVDEHAYTTGFAPRLRWERRHHENPGWVRPEVRDGTAGLTEEGILGLAFAEPTRATSRFGHERHWVRARVTGDPFDPDDVEDEGTNGQDGSNEGTSSSDQQSTDGGSAGLAACERGIETAPPGGEPSEAPPDFTGLHLNAGWARNVRLVEDELLGGSDGERDQSFAVSTPPAVDAEVWVDELSALSAPQRETLEAERPDGVEVERTTDGEVRAFWVRWERVADLLDSESDDRHFAVDAIDGEIRFGDGARGRIPPRGTNNVRASYRTGGGAAGNVPAGAVGDLKSSLPFVEAVTNPAPGAGGADTESTQAVLERAPQTLQDRGRAVMPADYERLAADASRRIARAKCIPAMDKGGNYQTGYVTVLVVPRESGETPVPSVGLIDRVETSLAEHAPASVVAGGRLVVRGPSYVSVAVEADVVAGDVGSLNAVEERCREAVDAFVHPLSGRDGEGWDFGELPTRSDVFALLEGVEGVDHVESLFLTFSGEETVTIGEGEAQPVAPEDALVERGDHDLTVSLRGGN